METISYIEDTGAWPVMVALCAAVEQELYASGLPGLCVCTPVPGPAAVMDRCGQCEGNDGCRGQGWTRWVTEFPSTDFPEPDRTGDECCAPMAYQLEVGIARCVPMGTSNAIGGITPPTPQEMVEVTRQQMADKAAVARAINRYLGERELSFFLSNAIPMQATGGCIGLVWNVTVWSV